MNKWDELDTSSFRPCTKHIIAYYREARNNKNKSGQHQPFSKFTGGKAWLLYLHARLAESGDRDLMQTSYPELDRHVSSTPDALNLISTSTPKSSQRVKINRLMKEKEDTVMAFKTSKVKEMEQADMEFLLKLQQQIYETDEEVIKAKKDLYKSVLGDERNSLKRKKTFHKHKSKTLRKQYEKLKSELNYQTPSDSSDDSDNIVGGYDDSE